MTSNDLKNLRADLKLYRGAKWELALALGVDPSKITKALHGLVKDEGFMASLQAKAKTILSTRKREAATA